MSDAETVLKWAGDRLLKMAVDEADRNGDGMMTARGAAIWDAGTWLREEAARELATICRECGGGPESCLRSRIKCCPDCTHKAADLKADA